MRSVTEVSMKGVVRYGFSGQVLVGCSAVVLVALLGATVADAQVTPLGGHHPTRGTGAGLEGGVSPTGGYQAAVPLQLPSPRGGDIPVPLSVVHTGSPRAGAAGAGFDIPLSYVRRSRQLRGRKPAIDGGPPPERIFLSLGSTMLMVPSDEPDSYVPFAADGYYVLKEQGDGSWIARDAVGRRYVFTDVSDFHDDMWLLKEVRAANGKDRVVLDYEVVYQNACKAPEIILTGLRYSFDAQGQLPLFEIDIDYRDWMPDYPCLDVNHGDEVPLGRVRFVWKIRVLARDNIQAGGLATELRSYILSCAPRHERLSTHRFT